VEIFIKSKNSSGEKTTNSDDDSKIEINDEAKK
jgi:hypothetical protein